jgi:hypothetical protein
MWKTKLPVVARSLGSTKKWWDATFTYTLIRQQISPMLCMTDVYLKQRSYISEPQRAKVRLTERCLFCACFYFLIPFKFFKLSVQLLLL